MEWVEVTGSCVLSGLDGYRSPWSGSPAGDVSRLVSSPLSCVMVPLCPFLSRLSLFAT